jgi:hypothetical protein
MIYAIICGMGDNVAVPYPTALLIGGKDIILSLAWEEGDRI